MTAAAYKQFLASPNQSLLADNATLHYITTLTNFAGAGKIIEHLTALRRQVTKKKEDIISAIEGQGAIAAEVDTSLEFLTSGGIYLPGLDDNFLSDRVAHLCITHFVSFDQDGKISQIRLQWDQGSLLKQLEIIGKSGRNWPIKDSREQIAQIQACLKSDGKSISQEATHNDLVMRNRASSKNALRDPHASLQLFGDREEIEGAGAAAVLSPYAGNKPRQRDFAEILGDNPKDDYDQRPVSPTKSGAGKNHPEMRIYDGSKEIEGSETLRNTSADPVIRPDPRKFQHFEFADGSDPQDAPKKGVDFDKKPRTKHDSQWSFDDFTTPHKVNSRVRSQDVRHWDTESNNQGPAEVVPGRARRDAETHFELQDDGERAPGDVRPAKPRGALHNEELGLYKNQLFDEEDYKSVNQRTLNNITNLKDRGKDFDSHFQMVDRSPAPERPQHVPEGKQKAVKMMDHSWEVYEQSPLQKNAPAKKLEGGTHLHIAGDGMGGKKGSTRNWLYGDDDDENVKPVAPRKGNQNASAASKNFWDF